MRSLWIEIFHVLLRQAYLARIRDMGKQHHRRVTPLLILPSKILSRVPIFPVPWLPRLICYSCGGSLIVDQLRCRSKDQEAIGKQRNKERMEITRRRTGSRLGPTLSPCRNSIQELPQLHIACIRQPILRTHNPNLISMPVGRAPHEMILFHHKITGDGL